VSGSWRERVKYSPLGRLAALPMRARTVLVPMLQQGGLSLIWLLRSREWANFSYDFEPVGLQAVLCAVNALTGHPIADLQSYTSDLKADTIFAQRYRERLASSRLRYTSDPDLHLGRCLVNYLLVRALRPRLIFEAGTERGLSTWAMCRALDHNGQSVAEARIITVDIASDRGEFLAGDENGRVQRLVGDSVAALREVAAPIQLFLHDTTNEAHHTREQLQTLAPKLAPGAVVHSCWFSLEFADFCRAHGLRGLEYVERPKHHWYSGRRCGLAVKPTA
jgi:predicted O-methyltransferase YrrM